MSYSQVNSSAPMVGELSSGWFAGNHGPEGAWSSLKGGALTPHELSYCEQSTNYNDGRVDSNGRSGSGTWNSNVIVTTGMTRGGGTMAH